MTDYYSFYLFMPLYEYLERVFPDDYNVDVANIIWDVKKGKVELDSIGVEWLWDKNREFVQIQEYPVC